MHALDENLNPLTPPDASTAKKIRDILSASGYLSCDYFKSAGKTGVPEDDKRGALLNGKTGGLAPGTIFEALFYAGETLNREPVKQALRPMEITEWVRLGLLREENDRVRANVQLLAYRDLVIAHDFKEHGLSRNHVIGITPATDALARLTIRRHSGDTLDLGAGSGVQALLAASHSDKVIATDINKRAVNIADFNAELNGCRNVENIAGNLFEPVAGKTFDLIVSCPPFVISPDSQYYYLDSGSTGDSMLERIVRESAGHLNEGGYCQLMSEVVQYSGQTWPRRLFGWLDGLGCDAWMLHRATMSPEEYARVWVMDRSESPEDLMREWLAYYREQNIEAITSGLLTIRKRSNAANWYRIDQLPAGIGDCGASIDQGFGARDFLDKRTSTNSLLSARLCLGDNVRLTQPGDMNNSGAPADTYSLNIAKGFVLSERIDEFFAEFLANCEKSTTVGQAVTATERAFKRRINRDEFVSVLRDFVLKGFLIEA